MFLGGRERVHWEERINTLNLFKVDNKDISTLTHLMPLVFFLYPRGFLMFSEVMEKESIGIK